MNALPNKMVQGWEPPSPPAVQHMPRRTGARLDRTEAEDGATTLVRKASGQTAAKSATPLVLPRGCGRNLPADEMLGVLAYSYARGVYSSEDIEREMLHNPRVKAALGDDVPDAETIRRFRRLNRGAILATLEQFFGSFTREPEAPFAAVPQAQSRSAEPVSRGNFHSLVKDRAERCLETAIIVDNVWNEP